MASFLLIHLFGASSGAFIASTMAIVLATVDPLAFLACGGWLGTICRVPVVMFGCVAPGRQRRPSASCYARISLVFMHLPDSNINGHGFATSHHQSLEQLEKNKGSVAHTVDRQSHCTTDEFTSALVTLRGVYRPTETRTQANYLSMQFPDHSDHMAVGATPNGPTASTKASSTRITWSSLQVLYRLPGAPNARECLWRRAQRQRSNVFALR